MRNALRAVGRLLCEYKWWWIVPLVVMVLLFGALVVLVDITGDSPFIYQLF